MKRILLGCSLIVGFALAVYAQAPPSVDYQIGALNDCSTTPPTLTQDTVNFFVHAKLNAATTCILAKNIEFIGAASAIAAAQATVPGPKGDTGPMGPPGPPGSSSMIPYGPSTTSVPGTLIIPACSFSGLLGGGSINPEEPSGDTGSLCDIGWLNAGEHVIYDLPIPIAGAYTVTARTAAPVGSLGQFHLEIAGATVSAAALKVPVTGGYHVWQATGATTVTLPAGLVPLAVVIDAGQFNIDQLTLTKQ